MGVALHASGKNFALKQVPPSGHVRALADGTGGMLYELHLDSSDKMRLGVPKFLPRRWLINTSRNAQFPIYMEWVYFKPQTPKH